MIIPKATLVPTTCTARETNTKGYTRFQWNISGKQHRPLLLIAITVDAEHYLFAIPPDTLKNDIVEINSHPLNHKGQLSKFLVGWQQPLFGGTA